MRTALLRDAVVTPSGHLLWPDHLAAVRYAGVRAMLYGTRQAVVQVSYDGRRMWHVHRAVEVVAEPCS